VQKTTAEVSRDFAHSLITHEELEMLERDQNYDFSFSF
jgi:hypothetical protein